MLQLFLVVVLELLYDISNKPEIETNCDWREIETNLQPQPQAFDCISNLSEEPL